MTSQAEAEAPLEGVRGLAFLGFPLHAAGRPATERGEHLLRIKIPMLFLQGTRDALAELDLLRPLVAGRPFLEAEVAWGVRHELALTVDDILSRRLRLSPELGDGSVAAAAALRVAEIMGRELAWSDDRRRQEAATYLEGAALEYAVPPPA
jgi:hypothetical protein